MRNKTTKMTPAQKAWVTRRAKAQKRSDAAKKAWASRRKMTVATTPSN